MQAVFRVYECDALQELASLQEEWEDNELKRVSGKEYDDSLFRPPLSLRDYSSIKGQQRMPKNLKPRDLLLLRSTEAGDVWGVVEALKNGAAPNAQSIPPQELLPPLHMAAALASPEHLVIAKLLLLAGADPNMDLHPVDLMPEGETQPQMPNDGINREYAPALLYAAGLVSTPTLARALPPQPGSSSGSVSGSSDAEPDVDVDAKVRAEYSNTHFSHRKCHRQMIELLMEHEETNPYMMTDIFNTYYQAPLTGMSALHVAALHGFADGVQILLEFNTTRPAQYTGQDSAEGQKRIGSLQPPPSMPPLLADAWLTRGFTALHFAVWSAGKSASKVEDVELPAVPVSSAELRIQHVNMLQLLVNSMCEDFSESVLTRTPLRLRTVLHEAALTGHDWVVRAILNATAAQACAGDSSSSSSISSNGVLAQLLAARDYRGHTALSLARRAPCHPALVQLLVEAMQKTGLHKEVQAQGRTCAAGEEYPSASSSSSSSSSASTVDATASIRSAEDEYMFQLPAMRSSSSSSSNDAAAGAEQQQQQQQQAGPLLRPLHAGLRCDIDIREASTLSMEEFLEDYYKVNRPVLITGNITAQWKAWQHWTPAQLLERYGELQLRAGPVPYGNQYSSKAELNVTELSVASFLQKYMHGAAGTGPAAPSSSSLQALKEQHGVRDVLELTAAVRSVPWIMFDPEIEKKSSKIQEEYDTPSYFLASEARRLDEEREKKQGQTGSPKDENKDQDKGSSSSNSMKEFRFDLQLSLGGKGSSAPFHNHIAAWNALLFGRKRWFLVAPNHVDTTLRRYMTSAATSTEADAATGSAEENRSVDPMYPSWLHAAVPSALWFLEEYSRYGHTGGTTGTSSTSSSSSSDSGDTSDVQSVWPGLVECTQGPGDVMFVPSKWAHSTLNLEDTLAVAQEFLMEPTRSPDSLPWLEVEVNTPGHPGGDLLDLRASRIKIAALVAAQKAKQEESKQQAPRRPSPFALKKPQHKPSRGSTSSVSGGSSSGEGGGGGRVGPYGLAVGADDSSHGGGSAQMGGDARFAGHDDEGDDGEGDTDEEDEGEGNDGGDGEERAFEYVF